LEETAVTTLSKVIGDILCSLHEPDTEVILGTDCGGKERVTFYYADPPSNEPSYVWVDASIAVRNEIKIVVEIEQSNITPVQFCGKVLATAASKYYAGRRGRYLLADSLLFIQIFLKKQTNENWSKRQRCLHLQNSIRELLPSDRTRITRYCFHWGTADEYLHEPRHAQELIAEIQDFLTSKSTESGKS
jgi:hypothetical protein